MTNLFIKTKKGPFIVPVSFVMIALILFYVKVITHSSERELGKGMSFFSSSHLGLIFLHHFLNICMNIIPEYIMMALSVLHV